MEINHPEVCGHIISFDGLSKSGNGWMISISHSLKAFMIRSRAISTLSLFSWEINNAISFCLIACRLWHVSWWISFFNIKYKLMLIMFLSYYGGILLTAA